MVKFLTPVLASPLEITDKDFIKPSRSIELPPLAQKILDTVKSKAKPVLLKQNILEKNLNNHKELTPKQSRDVLNRALYHPDLIGQSKAQTKPTYWVAVKLDKKNAVVVVDFTETKTHHEIVGWREIDEKGFARMKRQAEKEGGQFLITENDNVQGAAALSALQFGSSNNIPNSTQTVKPKTKLSLRSSRRGSVDFAPVGKAVDTLIDTFGKVGKKAYNAVKKAGSFGEWLKSMGNSVKNMTSEQISKLFNSAKSVEVLNESVERWSNF